VATAMRQATREAPSGCTSFACACQKMAPLGVPFFFVPVSFIAIFALLVATFGWDVCNSPITGAKHSPGVLQGCMFLASVSLCLSVAAAFVIKFGLRGSLELVHIPKNAGSSVEMAGLAHAINWGIFSLNYEGYQVMPDGNLCSRYHVPPALFASKPSPYLNRHTFCVTRDPVDRALSEYKFLLVQPWGPTFADVYQNGLYTYPACSDEGLNHFVQTALMAYQSGSRYLDDCHHLPQVDYIYGQDGSQMCEHILRLDSLSADFEVLMAQYGYPVRIGGFNQLDSSDTCNDLTRQAFTHQTLQMLRTVYADDFRLLNYTAP